MLTPDSVKKDGIVRLSVALAATPGDFDYDDEDLAPKRYRWKFPEVLPVNGGEWEQALSHVALPKLARGEVRQITKVNGKTTQELTARVGLAMKSVKLIDWWAPGGSAFLVQWWTKQLGVANLTKQKLLELLEL